MSLPFSYKTTYTLDKSHFSETFDESVVPDNSMKAYAKSAGFVLLGLILVVFFTEVSPYIAWFVVALGALEACSVRFRKPWWLARQMISRAANTELTLTIDEVGVQTKSLHVESELSWDNVTEIEQTQRGWLLHHARGKNYLSGRCLTEEAQGFIRQKVAGYIES